MEQCQTPSNLRPHVFSEEAYPQLAGYSVSLWKALILLNENVQRACCVFLVYFLPFLFTVEIQNVSLLLKPDDNRL